MLCRSCGQYNATGAVTCPACGERIRDGDNASDQQSCCPVCGGPKIACECPDCGEHLPNARPESTTVEKETWKWSLRRSLTWHAVIIAVLFATVSIVRSFPEEIQVVVVTWAVYGCAILINIGFGLLLSGCLCVTWSGDRSSPLPRRLIACGGNLSTFAIILGIAVGLLFELGIKPTF